MLLSLPARIAPRNGFRADQKPDFFLVGAPKCGTTALAHYLGRHPEIFMGPKEMHFFGRDLRFGKQFHRRCGQDYLAEYAARNGCRRAGDASVWYLFSASAAAEIKNFNPDARIIIMLREPTEMLYSLYHEFRFNGNERLPTFEAALAAEEQRRQGRGLTRGALFARGLLYRETAHYAEQVQRYFQAFPREQVHVILYDELTRDPLAVGRQALEFLELDSTFAPRDLPVRNSNKFPRNRLMHRVLTEPSLRSIAVLLWPWLPACARDLLRKVEAQLMRLNSSSRGRSPLSPGFRQELKREFAPEVERLSRLLDRDLTHWERTEEWAKGLIQ